MSRQAWSTVPISELCLGLYDGPHATPKPSNAGPVFLGIHNVREEGGLDLSDIRHISEEDFPAWTRRIEPRPGDIVLSYEATLHRYAVIPRGFRGCLGRRMALIRPDPAKVDERFLLYHFLGAEWRDTVTNNTISGSTVDRIPLIRFPEFEVSVPPLPIQRKIAGILSAYDDLIELNRRRISILEEMARRLYREWFVHFRFPGHGGVRMVDSALGPVPEGWEVVPFTDLADVLSGGTPRTSKPEYWNGPIPFFGPRDAQASFYVLETEKSITELGLSSCNSHLYPKDTVFITARGTVGNVVLPAVDMAMNQSCYALVGRQGISQEFLFLLTLQSVDYLKKNTGGATFETIVVDTFSRFDVLRPAASVVDDFTCRVRPLFACILNDRQRNAVLRCTRDLLLPKLISAELDVSELALVANLHSQGALQ